MRVTEHLTEQVAKGAVGHFRQPSNPWREAWWAMLMLTLAVPSLGLTTPLGDLMDTQLRRDTGDAVTAVCGGLASDDAGEFPVTDPRRDLFDRCGNMVGNALTLTDPDGSGGPRAKSLGLTQEELQKAIQTLATEEFAATKSFATEIGAGQTNVAIARLQAVRSGVRYGVAGLGIDGFDTLAEMDPRARAELGSRGGAAGDEGLGKWGFFLNGHYGFGERDGTDRENNFDFDRWGLTGGLDYRINDNFILGGLLSYHDVKADFKKSAAVPGGGINTDAWGIGGYGTYYKDNYYIDGLIGYNQSDYDITRRILLPVGTPPVPGNPAVVETNRTAKANTDSKSLSFSLGGGVDFARDNLSYGPFVRVNYLKVDVDGYKERGAFGLNLTVDEQDWKSLTSVLGGRISAAYSQDWGVIVPQARLGWVHEFENNSETFTAFYTADPRQLPLTASTDGPDRNYFELGLGVSAVLRGETQAFLDYQTLLGHKLVKDHVFTVGVRSAF